MKTTLIKTLTALAGFSAISSAQAFEPYNGPYVGIGGGYSHLHREVDTTFTIVEPGVPTLPVPLAPNKKDSIKGTLFAGYGLVFAENWYLGIEANFDTGSTSAAESTVIFTDEISGTPVGTSPFSSETKLKYSYGFSLLPGFLIDENFLVFVRGGYINGRFETADSFSLLFQPDDLLGVNYPSQEKNVSGYRLGFGGEYRPEYLNLRLRLEYYYDRYDSFSSTYDTNFLSPNEFDAISMHTSGDAQTNNVMLSLIYQFRSIFVKE